MTDIRAQHIYVRISIRRGQQYRFATGWQLPPNAKWDGKRGRLKQSRDNAVQVLAAQLTRLAQFIQTKEIWALSNDEERARSFYKTVLAEFRGEISSKESEAPWTLEKAFRQFLAHHENPGLPSKNL